MALQLTSYKNVTPKHWKNNQSIDTAQNDAQDAFIGAVTMWRVSRPRDNVTQKVIKFALKQPKTAEQQKTN